MALAVVAVVALAVAAAVAVDVAVAAAVAAAGTLAASTRNQQSLLEREVAGKIRVSPCLLVQNG